jgi:homoserine kinase
MRRVKVTLPGAATRLGPAQQGIGLALGLHTTIEIIERSDEALTVETGGEDSGRYSIGLRHPVVLGMMRVFQREERAALGLTIRVQNGIPHASGLGAEAAFYAAGIIAANNLLGNPLTRAQVVELAVSLGGIGAVSTILGGLTTSLLDESTLVYRSLPSAALKLVLALPELNTDPTQVSLPERVPMRDALENLNRVPLLLEALRAGDLDLLARAADDRLLSPRYRTLIKGYDRVLVAAKEAGAVTVIPTGLALLAFAPTDHDRIATAIQTAFQLAGVRSRTWTLPVDRQGVVISASQSS